MIRKITTFASNVTALKHLSMGWENLIWNILFLFLRSGTKMVVASCLALCALLCTYKFGLSNLPYWLKQKILFRPVRVHVLTIDEPAFGTTSRKRPPLVSDHLSTTRNFSHSKPYTWNLYTTTSCKRSRPAFLGCRFNNFPLFLTSCKRSPHALSDHYVHCVYYAI